MVPTSTIHCFRPTVWPSMLFSEPIPVPTPLDKIDPHCEDDDDDEYNDADIFVNLVSVDVETYARTHFNKSVKKTLTIPQWLNDMTTAKKINFSKVLQAVLKAELGVEA